MGNFNYAGLAARADRIMKRFGFDGDDGKSFLERAGVRRAVTLIESGYRPSESNEMFEPGDVFYIVSVIGETSPPDKEAGDLLVVIDANGDEDKYIMVTKPERVSPSGVNIFWQLHCRSR